MSRRHREAGQGSLETMGIAALAALLVAALIAAMVTSSPTMTASITSNICKIVTLGQGDCAVAAGSDGASADRAPQDYVPPEPCVVGSDADSESGGVAITFVRVEGNGTWMVEDLGDGRARLTRVSDSSVGGTIGIGASATITLDGDTLGLAASADAQAMLGAGEGDVYYADSHEIAQLIMGDKKSDETKDAWFGDGGPIRWVADTVGGKGAYEDLPPDEWFDYDTASVGGQASATLLWGTAEAQATVELYLGTRHYRDGGTTEYYQAGASFGASADILAAEAGIDLGANATIEVDRDKDGNPVAMRLISQTVVHPYAGDSANPAGDPELQTTTIQIPLTSESDRDLASRVLWAVGVPFMPGISEGITDIDAIGAPWQVEQIGKDLGRAAADRGYMWKQTQTVQSSENGFNVSGKLGIELGVDATWSSTQLNLTDYSYWDGRQWASRPGCSA